MKLGLFHFQLLYQILERIHFTYDENELADTIVSSVANALDAEGGTIFRLRDGNIVPLAAYGTPLERLKQMSFEKGRGVIGWVVQHGQPVKVDNPQQDPRFSGGIDAITGFKTKTILAAPIVAKGSIIGVIEFLNRKEGPFTIPDLELVSMVGREIGIAFENATLVAELTHTRAMLAAMTDSFAAGVLMVDQQGSLLKVNPSAFRLLGIKGVEAEWIGRNVSELLETMPTFLAAVKEVMDSAAGLSRREVIVPTATAPRLIGYSGVPVKEKGGNRIGSALLFQDITAYANKK